TKVFNTFEGGAVISHTREMKEKIDRLRSFGYIDEEHIQGIGLNGKMNEFQSAVGLVQLKYIKGLINKRKVVSDYYKENLKSIEGISVPEANMDYIHNFAFFPIIVTEQYSLSRDELYELLKLKGIHTRKYFYPLISNLIDYRNLRSSKVSNLPVSNKIANMILCLPIYPDLKKETMDRLMKLVSNR
ncbi:MAG: DegT/DnrJ/EryC1/StrS family aminotransferase, partial [Chlorobi bacterium]|nr:DegT/DnrJ/EryC1/StrS family aminotransferase [Chlorobiota bacterium]